MSRTIPFRTKTKRQFPTIVLLFITSSSSFSTSLLTSCTDVTGEQLWNNKNVDGHLRSWLRSRVSVRKGRIGNQLVNDNLETWLYDPVDNTYSDNIAGWNDQLELDDDGEEEEDNRKVVTLARFLNGRPVGRVWQWVGRREVDGWLYFENVTTELVGSQVPFLYPDLRTGLRGEWTGEKILRPRVVHLVAERCRDGLKEVKTIRGSADYGKDGAMDPFERKQVHVGISGKSGGGEGLFAKRQFLPGELVSYFSGVRTFEEDFLFDNMTVEEENEATSYYFGLEENSPGWWGLPEGQVLDIPIEMRSITKFRTTLGHKTNCAFFEEQNTEFDTVRHPVLGPIVILVASKPIAKEEEVLTSYNYDLKEAPDWYRKEYKRALKANRRKEKNLD